jgi:hypothetical protein
MSGLEPLMWASLASTAIGTISSISGSNQSYNAESSAAQYNAEVARLEAKAEEDRIRRDAATKLGRVRAGIAKSGVTVEGTPLMVLAETAELSELDALNARWNGESQAKLYDRRAQSAQKAKSTAAGSALLSGVSQGISTYSSFQ